MSNGQCQVVGTLLLWQGMDFQVTWREISTISDWSLIFAFSFCDSFIENFGTHVITSVTIGGKDVIYVKQHQSSPLSTMEIKNYVQDIGNQRFSDTESNASSGPMKLKDKASPRIFLYSCLLFSFINLPEVLDHQLHFCFVCEKFFCLLNFTGCWSLLIQQPRDIPSTH